MKSRFFLSILTVMLTLSFTALVAIAGEIHCPASIMETPTVSTKEKQWTVVATSGERYLERVGIYFRDTSMLLPELLYGAQVPDSEKTFKKKETATWIIPKGGAGTFWIGCSYTDTAAILFQKVDPNIKVCVASYDLLPTGRRQRLSSMVCQ